MSKALSQSTKELYQRAWAQYERFAMIHGLAVGIPIPVQDLLCFITSLYNKGCPASTVSSTLSGISYFHKIQPLPVFDPTHHFAVTQLRVAIRKERPSLDFRKPVTEIMLHAIFDTLAQLNLPIYDLWLFRSVYSFMFYFGLRIGEVAQSVHTIQRGQLSVSSSKLTLAFSSYKHAPLQPFSHVLQANDSIYCPVSTISNYLAMRGDDPGPLFQLGEKSIPKALVSHRLKEVLSRAGIEATNISSHSFRIGAASLWAQRGMSEEEIMRLGRWKSSAWKKYMRHDVNHIT